MLIVGRDWPVRSQSRVGDTGSGETAVPQTTLNLWGPGAIVPDR